MIQSKHHHQHMKKTKDLPGAFRWFQDDAEEFVDNSTNLTYGTWVWCRNES